MYGKIDETLGTDTLATYMYNHCNICNIPIYFVISVWTHLQHTSKTFESFEMYAWNMHPILALASPICVVKRDHTRSALSGPVVAERAVSTCGHSNARAITRSGRQREQQQEQWQGRWRRSRSGRGVRRWWSSAELGSGRAAWWCAHGVGERCDDRYEMGKYRFVFFLVKEQR
jgi:hypothetical protein